MRSVGDPRPPLRSGCSPHCCFPHSPRGVGLDLISRNLDPLPLFFNPTQPSYNDFGRLSHASPRLQPLPMANTKDESCDSPSLPSSLRLIVFHLVVPFPMPHACPGNPRWSFLRYKACFPAFFSVCTFLYCSGLFQVFIFSRPATAGRKSSRLDKKSPFPSFPPLRMPTLCLPSLVHMFFLFLHIRAVT